MKSLHACQVTPALILLCAFLFFKLQVLSCSAYSVFLGGKITNLALKLCTISIAHENNLNQPKNSPVFLVLFGIIKLSLQELPVETGALQEKKNLPFSMAIRVNNWVSWQWVTVDMLPVFAESPQRCEFSLTSLRKITLFCHLQGRKDK